MPVKLDVQRKDPMSAPQSTTSEAPTPAAVTLRGPVNEAAAYGVRLEPANAPGDSPFWQVVNVRHLSADENRGKHNVFVRVLDATGQRDRNPALRAAYTWEGRRPDESAPPRPLDKGDADLGHADIDVNKGQHISVWIEGDGLPSARVANLHTDHEANEKTQRRSGRQHALPPLLPGHFPAHAERSGAGGRGRRPLRARRRPDSGRRGAQAWISALSNSG
jgi:hypothetical protein